MKDFAWMSHPAMKNIDARKMAILIELANESEGKPADKSLPLIMKANAQLKAMGLTFSNEEADLMVDILTKDMSPAEKQKVDMIKKMMPKNKGK